MGFDPGNGLSSLSVSLANTSDFGIDIQVVDASGNVVAHTGYTTTGGSLTYTPTTPLGPTAASDLRVRVVNDPVTWNALYARVNTVRVSWTSALINPSGLADLKSYSYDANGRPLTLTDSPAGEPTTSVSYVYDPSGSVAAIVDQNRNVKASYGYTAYGQSNLSLASNAHGIYPRANPVQYAGSQYDIASDTYDVNDQRYSPDLERSLGAGSTSHTAAAQSPVNANRQAFENANDSCVLAPSLGCGSFALTRLAANQSLATRIAAGRKQRQDTWMRAWWAYILRGLKQAQEEADWLEANPNVDLTDPDEATQLKQAYYFLVNTGSAVLYEGRSGCCVATAASVDSWLDDMSDDVLKFLGVKKPKTGDNAHDDCLRNFTAWTPQSLTVTAFASGCRPGTLRISRWVTDNGKRVPGSYAYNWCDGTACSLPTYTWYNVPKEGEWYDTVALLRDYTDNGVYDMAARVKLEGVDV